MAATPKQIAALGQPTPIEEVKTRQGPKGLELSYIDARYVFDTLDTEVGGENWASDFREIHGRLVGGIGVLVERRTSDAKYGEWVWKWDVGVESDIEAEKGEFSDAIKRAGVHWGIARDLYDARSDVRKAKDKAKPAAKAKRSYRKRTEPDTDKPAEKVGLSDSQRAKLMAALREAGLETSAQRKALTIVVTQKDSVKEMTNSDFDKIIAVLDDPDDETNEGIIAMAREVQDIQETSE